jgi:hypothetical protein
MSYTKNNQGQTTVFHTEPERAPVPYGMLWLAVAPAFIFSFVSWIAVVITFIIFGALAWFWTVYPGARRYRKPSNFSVTADGLSVDGKQIQKRDIHRVIIRNHILSDDNSQDAVYLQSGAMGALTTSAMAKKRKSIRKLGAVSYRLDVEAGGVSHPLAGGLNETTAFAVLSDVSDILGLSVSNAA